MCSAVVQEFSPLNLPAGSPEGLGRRAALQALARHLAFEAQSVSYASRGRVLVIGPERPALEAAAHLQARGLHCAVLASPAGQGESARPEGVPLLRAAPASLEGHLGAFRATAALTNGPVDLGRLAGGEDGAFDLVLDLGAPALLTMEVPPPGYLAPGTDPQALAGALAALPELVGEFDKPRYFSYDPQICAHGERGLAGCSRCLQACPTQAIRSLGERIEVDPHLCQGGGSCATVCPTGAIRYAYPPSSVLLGALRQALRSYREHCDTRPVLLLHGSESGRERYSALAPRLPEAVLPVELEEIGSAGLEAWLCALAYGAGAVALLLTPDTPASMRRALAGEVALGRALLEGLGYPAWVLRVVDTGDDAAVSTLLDHREGALAGPPAGFQAFDEKRTNLQLALEHLHAHAPRPAQMIELPAGAPFGSVRFDPAACTLCMACVAVCPAAALSDGSDTPRLQFVERNCVQCALCVSACPENALIGLIPRMSFDPGLRDRARVLHEEQPLCCVACGKPFATQSMMRTITAKLKDHWMFQDQAALRRLQMCEDCRVRDMLQEQARS